MNDHYEVLGRLSKQITMARQYLRDKVYPEDATEFDIQVIKDLIGMKAKSDFPLAHWDDIEGSTAFNFKVSWFQKAIKDLGAIIVNQEMNRTNKFSYLYLTIVFGVVDPLE